MGVANDEASLIEAETWKEVGQRYLRLVEILIGLSGGIIGVLCAFLVQAETIKHLRGAWFLLTSLILFGVSLVLGVLSILYYTWSLEANPRFRIGPGNLLEADTKQATLWTWHNWLIGVQTFAFFSGAAFLLLFVGLKL